MTILERSIPFELRDDVSTEGDGLTFSGYAAVFDQETEINSWEGTFTERIRKGAFRKTLRERIPVLQFEHGRHPLIGSIPIGRIDSIREDDYGLSVAARLTDNWLIQPVREAIKDRAITGMSFRFEVIRDEWRDVNGKLIKSEELWELLWDAGDRGPITRTLIELKVHEVGPVVFPAYAGTSADVRAVGLAETIKAKPDRLQAIRRSLARAEPSVYDDVSDDVRYEVARRLLFSAPPASMGHPEETRNIEPQIEKEREETDAPSTEGHPSQLSRISPDRIRLDAANRREYLALILKGSDRYA